MLNVYNLAVYWDTNRIANNNSNFNSSYLITHTYDEMVKQASAKYKYRVSKDRRAYQYRHTQSLTYMCVNGKNMLNSILTMCYA